MCVLYFGWPNQPSSGTMKILYWNVIFLLQILVKPEIRGEDRKCSAAVVGLDLCCRFRLIPIEKIFSNRDSIRKAREAFLIQKGKTIDPDGLNIREETY